jgi:hypothetical protein
MDLCALSKPVTQTISTCPPLLPPPAHLPYFPLPTSLTSALQRLVARSLIALALFHVLFIIFWTRAQDERERAASLAISDEELLAQQAVLRGLLASWPAHLPRAAVVMLCRNSDLDDALGSMAQLEARWDRGQYAYPYVFINDDAFTVKFKQATTLATAAPTFYGRVPKEHWSYPSYVNKVGGGAWMGVGWGAGQAPNGCRSYLPMMRCDV